MSFLLLASSFTEIRPGLIFYTIITFVLLALVLRWKAWGPILDLAQERENHITQSIEAAKKERAEAERLLAEQKAAVAEARREAAESLRRSQAEVEKFREELMAKSRAEAESIKIEAQRTIQEERAKAVAEIRGVAADLAVEIARKIIGSELDASKHKALADAYIDSLPKAVPPATRA